MHREVCRPFLKYSLWCRHIKEKRRALLFLSCVVCVFGCSMAVLVDTIKVANSDTHPLSLATAGKELWVSSAATRGINTSPESH